MDIFVFFNFVFLIIESTAYVLAHMCIFIGLVLFHPYFLLKNLFCTSYTKQFLSGPEEQKCPL